METIQLAILARESAALARRLISEGKLSTSRSWRGPSASIENSYIEANGWEAYGKWFLGRDSDANEDTKAAYSFPFSDDFKTVSMNGLRAIRQRSSQADDESIFAAAGVLFTQAKEKVEANSLRAFSYGQGSSAVNEDEGVLNDVTMVEVGEARGHGILVTKKTLIEAANQLQGKSLPAYITHANANGDRLTTEIGYFSGFYLDAEQPSEGKEMSIKARTFRAFESFKKYQPEAYERLFEMARALPENFGISLVFEASLYWETQDGSVPYEGMSEKPEDSLYEWPSVEMTSIQSADFVDNPAATSSLFSQSTTTKNLKTMNTPELVELTTAASDELERRKAEEAAGKDKPKTAEKKKPKKKLSEPDEEAEAVIEETPESEKASESTEVEAQQEVIDELEDKVKTLTAKLNENIAETEKLRSLMDGADIIDEDAAPEIKEEIPPTQLKSEAVSREMEANPKLTRSQALLEVGKKHPEFFTMTTLNQLN